MATSIKQQRKQVGYLVLDQICKTLLANSKTYLSPSTYTEAELNALKEASKKEERND